MKQEPFSVHNWQKAVRKTAEPALARMLKDFAPRFLPDAMVEILPPDAQAAPDVQTLPDEPEAQEQQELQAEFFTPAELKKMTPLAGAEKETAPVPQDVDLEALRQEAFARGEEKQRVQMEEAFSTRLAALEEAHAAALTAVRKEVAAEYATQLEKGLQEGLGRIETALSGQLADILAAFMGERLQQDALKLLAGRIAAESAGTEEPLVVEGDSALLDAFQALPGFDAARYRLAPSDAREIRIVQGDTVLSTRIAPLMKELRGLFE